MVKVASVCVCVCLVCLEAHTHTQTTLRHIVHDELFCYLKKKIIYVYSQLSDTLSPIIPCQLDRRTIWFIFQPSYDHLQFKIQIIILKTYSHLFPLIIAYLFLLNIRKVKLYYIILLYYKLYYIILLYY